jgi:hypothetical protein
MSHFTSGEELLNAACALLVEEVAVEPGFRRLVRTAYYRYVTAAYKRNINGLEF